jgi:hypothetical protein
LHSRVFRNHRLRQRCIFPEIGGGLDVVFEVGGFAVARGSTSLLSSVTVEIIVREISAEDKREEDKVEHWYLNAGGLERCGST